jgi:hypothetical protein
MIHFFRLGLAVQIAWLEGLSPNPLPVRIDKQEMERSVEELHNDLDDLSYIQALLDEGGR